MDRFFQGLKIGKELVNILGDAILDILFNFSMFIVEGIMIVISLIVWLAILALFLMMSG
ncbi:MAG: hypothetical protein ACTSVO_03505 [Candidatus Heimdallarchaeaceae archaeon]